MELEQIAKQYRDEGYVVITHPDADHLPGFAGDFGIDLLATRGDERVLVQVKQDRAALEADPNVPARAGITNTPDGGTTWYYSIQTIPSAGAFVMLGSHPLTTPEQLDDLLPDCWQAAQPHRLGGRWCGRGVCVR